MTDHDALLELGAAGGRSLGSLKPLNLLYANRYLISFTSEVTLAYSNRHIELSSIYVCTRVCSVEGSMLRPSF